MIRAASKAWSLPFYPWLLIIIPILHYYRENLGLVDDEQVQPTVLLALAGTSLAFACINRLIRDRYLSAAITSLCGLVFALSGHLYLELFMPRSLGVWTIMALLALGLACIALRKWGSRSLIAQTTPALNAALLTLLAYSVIMLAADIVAESRYAKEIPAYTMLADDEFSAPKAHDSAAKPDIYYIIPDGYPSDDWLEQTADWDNSAFSAALEERGFTVVGHAQSNYPITVVSLASTLNMQYYGANPSPYSDKVYLRLETAGSKVARFLLDSGYTFVQLLSHSFYPSPLADIVTEITRGGAVAVDIEVKPQTVPTRGGDQTIGAQRDGAELNLLIRSYKHPFYDAYFDTTILRLARSRLIPLLFGEPEANAPLGDREPEKFLNTIEEAVTISEMPEATFTIIHLLKPHIPVVFDEDCNILPVIYMPSTVEFGAQMKCINAKFLYLIDAILAASENPPVILFQADHSSVMGDAPKSRRMTYFDVYAAYYLPPPHSLDFPRPFTTINSFPLILNEVFGSQFELQPDRLFEMTQRYDAPFAQVDVTEEFLHGAIAHDAA